MSRAPVFAILGFLLLGACAPEETSTTASSERVSPTYAGPAEAAYCSSSLTFGAASTITVSGRATYVRRETFKDIAFEGLGSSSLTHPTRPAGEYPIRAAEIRVTDPSGSVVQCGRTATDGTYSLTLPAGDMNYTLSVNSRSATFNGTILMNASVLNKPEANQFYSLSTTVNAGNGNLTNQNLRATADTSGQMLGAAFNILDQIYAANAYLKAKTSGCGGDGCTAITSAVTRKVSAYWEKGFNPNDYFGGRGGLSFYLPGYYRLFILGGVSGEIDHGDTDHFDNSVILHEYGHFLEDALFTSDSPGGSHNGDRVIDPRLAWSEGWGNFIQAAVLTYEGTMDSSDPRYFDTSGNIDGTADLFFEVDLENHSVDDRIDSGMGEGNFREFAVTRFLMDVVDGTKVADDDSSDFAGPSTFNDNINDNFARLWTVLTKSSGGGLRQSNLAFRNIGHVHLAEAALAGGSTWGNLRSGNFHVGNTSEYAQYVTSIGNGGVCATLSTGLAYSIDPHAATATANYSNSNLFTNNNFYHFKISTAGTYTIQLRYKDAGGGQEADLDLYVYNEDAVFASSADLIGRSYADPTPAVGNMETESVTAHFAAGNYLINVHAHTGAPFNNATEAQYSISVSNGIGDLCPASL